MTFIYDLLSWLLFDRFPLGRAAYLEEEGDVLLWMSTLHQFWFLPLICVIVYCEYSGQLRLMKRYWFFGCILNFLLAVLAKTHFEEQRLVLGQAFTFVPDFGTSMIQQSVFYRFSGPHFLMDSCRSL
jgi:hypothetical protein